MKSVNAMRNLGGLSLFVRHRVLEERVRPHVHRLLDRHARNQDHARSPYRARGRDRGRALLALGAWHRTVGPEQLEAAAMGV